VWDLRDRQRVGAFKTTFDYGGQRLALSDAVDLLFTAAYHRFGLTAHSTTSGEIRWHRPDLKKVQMLTLSADGERLFCGREGFPCEIISASDGKSLGSFRGARRVMESKWEPMTLLDRLNPVVQETNGATKFQVLRETFAILDATFAPGRLYVSESGGSVRCLSTRDGQEIWRYDPTNGSHIVTLAYRSVDDCLLGIEWPYEHGGNLSMLTWKAQSGLTVSSIDIASYPAYGICRDGQLLITGGRQVISSIDGQHLFAV